jgi:restriction endonuclease Mrr
VNRELLFNTIQALNTDKIETASLLNKYFRADGLNVFKAAEEAEKNINSYISFCNEEIQYSAGYGTVSLIGDKTNQNVTLFNNSYFFVQELKHHLLYSISDQEFEVICSKVLKHYLHAENTGVTKRSGDGGYDFYGTLISRNKDALFPCIAVNVYGQSKQYRGNISRPELDKFIGFAKTNFTTRNFKPTVYIFATTSDFSTDALAKATEQGIICWNGFQIASFIYQSALSSGTDPKILLDEYLNN